MADASTRPPAQEQSSLAAVQELPEFVELRRRLRSFVFPMTAAFLAWYLLYVLCSAFARGFMAHKLVGNINVGLVFGLLQFITTFGIAYLYSRYARRRLDPLADKLRAELGAQLSGRVR
jgi:uncharacterized membrane protein (DUF485 family)